LLSQVNQNLIDAFTVALTDTQAKIPFTNIHPMLAWCQSLSVFHTCCSWALVMWCLVAVTVTKLVSMAWCLN